jgi:hypothetical protein
MDKLLESGKVSRNVLIERMATIVKNNKKTNDKTT